MKGLAIAATLSFAVAAVSAAPVSRDQVIAAWIDGTAWAEEQPGGRIVLHNCYDRVAERLAYSDWPGELVVAELPHSRLIAAAAPINAPFAKTFGGHWIGTAGLSELYREALRENAWL